MFQIFTLVEDTTLSAQTRKQPAQDHPRRKVTMWQKGPSVIVSYACEALALVAG